MANLSRAGGQPAYRAGPGLGRRERAQYYLVLQDYRLQADSDRAAADDRRGISRQVAHLSRPRRCGLAASGAGPVAPGLGVIPGNFSLVAGGSGQRAGPDFAGLHASRRRAADHPAEHLVVGNFVRIGSLVGSLDLAG